MPNCPKCGDSYQPNETECSNCGIVFAKYQTYKENAEIKRQAEIKGAKYIRRSIILCVSLFVLFIPSVAFTYILTNSDKLSWSVAGLLIFLLLISALNILFVKCPRCNNSFIFNFMTLDGQIKSIYPFSMGLSCNHCGFNVRKMNIHHNNSLEKGGS